MRRSLNAANWRGYTQEYDMHDEGVNFRGRRRFLRQAVTAAGGGVVALLAVPEKGAGAERAVAGREADGQGPQGYRLSAHIRSYYDTLRS